MKNTEFEINLNLLQEGYTLRQLIILGYSKMINEDNIYDIKVQKKLAEGLRITLYRVKKEIKNLPEDFVLGLI